MFADVIWTQSFLKLQSLILIRQKFIIKFPFFTEDFIIYSMTANDGLVLDVSFIIRFKVTNFLTKRRRFHILG